MYAPIVFLHGGGLTAHTWDGRWMRKHDMRWLQRNAGELAARFQNEWRDFAKVACPTLIVRGALSDAFADEDAEALARALPEASWVKVEGAGHTVQGDNPGGLCEVLRDFLGRKAT